jgi:hypothetical protein
VGLLPFRPPSDYGGEMTEHIIPDQSGAAAHRPVVKGVAAPSTAAILRHNPIGGIGRRNKAEMADSTAGGVLAES